MGRRARPVDLPSVLCYRRKPVLRGKLLSATTGLGELPRGRRYERYGRLPHNQRAVRAQRAPDAAAACHRASRGALSPYEQVDELARCRCNATPSKAVSDLRLWGGHHASTARNVAELPALLSDAGQGDVRET